MPPLNEMTLRKLTAADKNSAITAAGGEMKFQAAGQFLESPELAVGVAAILIRGRHAGDNAHRETRLLQTAVSEILINELDRKSTRLNSSHT